ncbi:MAG: efflux RND transporter periplasmic adaptor subunit, partial [Lentisphaeraceae bacterium]|nr:efflux RND transporter periplasmic adaptor subunit [Lentisphaeraceae bacterium]
KNLTGHNQTNIFLNSLIELNEFDGKPSEFFNKLINTKRLVVEASGAVLLRKTGDTYGLVTSSPPLNGKSPEWLNIALKKLQARENLDGLYSHKINDDEDSSYKDYLAYIPLKPGVPEMGIEVYYLHARDISELNYRLQKLQILLPYYNFYEGKVKLKDFQEKTERMYKAFEIIIKLNTFDGFLGSLMALCNELAANWSCSRVSFGLKKSRYIKIKAISNSEKFNKKTDVVRDLEKVMEECYDQNLEIPFPQDGDGGTVARSAKSFSEQHGPVSLVSLPLRRSGQLFGVLTFERGAENPFTKDEIEVFRLIADLYTPRLEFLKKNDRFIAVKIAEECRKFSSMMIGAKHTWLKLIVLALLGLAYWLSVAKGMYQVESTFTFEPNKTHIVTAPFNGEIIKINVENGQRIEKDVPLFKLDATEMRLQQNSLLSNRLEAQKKAAVALREGNAAEEQIARAEAKGIDAEIELTEYFLSQAEVKAPIGGMVVSEELKKREFSVIELGKPLLEIVDDSQLKIILFVPEDQIADIELGRTGELAAAGYPDSKIKFRVIDVENIARVVSGANVFKVKAEFLDGEKLDWLKPGMEGVARINVEERLYAWIWTRKAINWLRMKFWF